MLISTFELENLLIKIKKVKGKYFYEVYTDEGEVVEISYEFKKKEECLIAAKDRVNTLTLWQCDFKLPYFLRVFCGDNLVLSLENEELIEAIQAGIISLFDVEKSAIEYAKDIKEELAGNTTLMSSVNVSAVLSNAHFFYRDSHYIKLRRTNEVLCLVENLDTGEQQNLLSCTKVFVP